MLLRGCLRVLLDLKLVPEAIRIHNSAYFLLCWQSL